MRLPQLDILRGVAVLLVLARHLAVGYPFAGRLQPLVRITFDFGWTGVDLFFVLSGFLVGGLLFKEWRQRSRIDIPRFLIRRGFKIWPAYFIYIAAMAVLYTADGSLGPPRQALTLLSPNFAHFQSYLPTPLLHTWSLSVEEHFYLALPLILLLAARRPAEGRLAVRTMFLVTAGIIILLGAVGYSLRSPLPLASFPNEMQTYLRPYVQSVFLWLVGAQLLSLVALFLLLPRFWKTEQNELAPLPMVALGVLLLCFGFRICNQWLAARLGIDWTFNFFASHLRIDSLFFGVLLGYWHHFREGELRRVARHRGLLCLAAAALVSGAIYLVPQTSVATYGFIPLYLGYGCLLMAVVYSTPGEGWLGRCLSSLPARLLAFIGFYSYSIYLWHINSVRNRIDQWVYERLGAWLPAEPRWLATTLLSVGGAVLVGVAMAKLIEQPCLRLRDRLFPGRADALASRGAEASV